MIQIRSEARQRAAARLRHAGLLGALLAFAVCAQAQQPQSLPTTTLSVGMHNIKAQVALTPVQRHTGLMFRREMATHEGMLFIFEYPESQCFWMRNTPLPLSIAFLADDGTVEQLADMKPHDDNTHCSTKPVRFALEMNQGWFAKRGVKPGTKIAGAPFQK
jgi:uncharacterized protein